MRSMTSTSSLSSIQVSRSYKQRGSHHTHTELNNQHSTAALFPAVMQFCCSKRLDAERLLQIAGRNLYGPHAVDNSRETMLDSSGGPCY